MRFPQIADSLLSTDLYKFTMMQAVQRHYPEARVRYRFRCRNKDVNLAPIAEEISAQVDALCALKFTEPELAYLKSLRFMNHAFVDSLAEFRLPRESVVISDADGDLDLQVVGIWRDTILFEVPLLYIVTETWYRTLADSESAFREREAEGRRRLHDKIAWLNAQSVPDGIAYRFMEFGTRRRFSRDWQAEVVRTLAEQLPNHMMGTSNVKLAMDNDLTAFGTMAHEWLQAHQALAPIPTFQRAALQTWADEYRGDLGIALSDVVGFEPFLRDFDRYFALLFTGCRHDSGDPVWWTELLLAHYDRLHIDSRTKQAMYSDGQTFESSLELTARYGSRIQVGHGIGTYLTCDMGIPALNVVIKMVECEGMPVAKISDSSGKGMCEDPDYLRFLSRLYRRSNSETASAEQGVSPDSSK